MSRRASLSLFLTLGFLTAAAKPTPPAASQPAADEAPTIFETKLAKPQQIINLPAPADQVISAGGGRYLIFRCKRIRSIAVLDLCKASIIKVMELPPGDAQVAAGLTKLFVSSSQNNSISRYRLSDFQKELTVLQPEKGVQAMAMGSGSTGPLVVSSGKRTLLYDPANFSSAHLGWEHWGNDQDNWPAPGVRLSGNGETIVALGGGWMGMEIATVDGTTIVDRRSGGGRNSDLVVTYDGTLIFDGGRAIGADGAPTGVQVDGTALATPGSDFIMAFNEKPPALKFYVSGGRQLIWSMDDPKSLAGSSLPPDQRIFYLPAAKVLAAVQPGNDRVELRKVDIIAELAKSDIDYLLVTSIPPTTASRGKTYRYQVQAASKRGGVKCSLSSGPSGMTLSEDGKLEWNVPEDFEQNEGRVVISVSDFTGQEVFHTFTIHLPKKSKSAPPPTPEPDTSGKGV